jgi:hypothetical protein
MRSNTGLIAAFEDRVRERVAHLEFDLARRFA